MNAIQTQTQLNLEVLGFGPVPSEPTQIGQWWVVPYRQYHSTIPSEAWKKANDLIASGVKVSDWLILDDIELVRAKQEEKRRKEEEERRRKQAEQMAVIGKVLGYILVGGLLLASGVGLLLLAGLAGGLAYDPVLVAVLEDGRWICVHSWYEQ